MSKAGFYRIAHKPRKTHAQRRRADAGRDGSAPLRPSALGKERRRPMWWRRIALARLLGRR